MLNYGLVVSIFCFSLEAFAGGSCLDVKILKILKETPTSLTFEIEHDFASPVAVSERAAVKGKRKNVSLIHVEYGMNTKGTYTVPALDEKHAVERKDKYAKSFATCSKILKEKAAKQDSYCLGFMAGDFPKGYERLYRSFDVEYVEQHHPQKFSCYLTPRPRI